MMIELKKKDYIWSYIGVFLSLFSSIIMTPFVVYYLDGEMYGLWGVYQSLAAITVLFDFGFSTTFARNINYCWNGASALARDGVQYASEKSPNYYLMKKTMKACQLVFFLISAVALITMLTVGTIYIQRISSHLDGIEPLISWLLCAIAIFMNLFFGYYNSFLRGVGAISDVNQATVIAKLTQILATIILLASGFGIIGTSIAYLLYGTLFRMIAKKRFLKYKNIGQCLKNVAAKVPLHEIKEMFLIVWHNAWREGLVSLSNYLANQGCTIICSLYMPLTQTGAYSLGVHLATAVSTIAAAMYTANQPVLQSAYINKDAVKVKRTMSLIVFSFTVLNALGLAMVVVVGLPVLRLIRPETIVSAGVMLVIGIYQFVLKFRNCYTSYFSCTNRIPYVKSFILSSALCVVLGYITLKYLKWGLWGLVGSQIVSQSIYNLWAWPIKAHKEMEMSVKETVLLGSKEMVIILKGFMKRSSKP